MGVTKNIVVVGNANHELNKLELAILLRITIKYIFIEKHIPFLKVESRENTGVGMYVNFSYDSSAEKILDFGLENASLATDESIEMEGLKYGLAYEVNVINGKIKFLELVTYSEEWDGKVSDNFAFVK